MDNPQLDRVLNRLDKLKSLESISNILLYIAILLTFEYCSKPH